MNREELKQAFMSECTTAGSDGKPVVKGTPADIIAWITEKFVQSDTAPFSKAFTGMRDKNGKPIHEGDRVRIYYKGEFVICQVVYDVKHAAFFLKWPDGYINQYFMNGPNYEVTEAPDLKK